MDDVSYGTPCHAALSEWGTKPGQEVILAVRLRRDAFDEILTAAVHSSFVPDLYGSETEWKKAASRSFVRLQWDPDRHPSGSKLERRAIQLGLRGDFLSRYARDWIINIEDISEFVQEQHRYKSGELTNLLTPSEYVYPVKEPLIAKRLGLSKVCSCALALKRRSAPDSIAGKGKTKGSLVSPIVNEQDWECLK